MCCRLYMRQSDHLNPIFLRREWQEKEVDWKCREAVVMGSREGLEGVRKARHIPSVEERLSMQVLYILCLYCHNQTGCLVSGSQCKKINKIFFWMYHLLCKFFYYLPPLQFFPNIYCPQYRIYKVSLSMSQNHAMLLADLVYISDTCQKEILS